MPHDGRSHTAWKRKLDSDIARAVETAEAIEPSIAVLLANRDTAIATAMAMVEQARQRCAAVDVAAAGYKPTAQTAVASFLDSIRVHPPQFMFPVPEGKRIHELTEQTRRGVSPMMTAMWEVFKTPMLAYEAAVKAGIVATGPAIDVWRDGDKKLQDAQRRADELRKLPEEKARQRYDEEVLSAEVLLLDAGIGGEPSGLLKEWLAMARLKIAERKELPYLPCPPRWFPPAPIKDYRVPAESLTFSYLEEKDKSGAILITPDPYVEASDDPIETARELFECHLAIGEDWLQGAYV